MKSKLIAVLILASAMVSPVMLSDQSSGTSAEAVYYQPDGVIKVVPETPLAEVPWGAEILRSDGTVYWSSILVSYGGESEVFLMEVQSRVLYDMPDGTYTVTLYPKSGSFEDVTATLVVHNEQPSGNNDSMIVILAVVLIAVVIVATFLIYRRTRT